MFLVALPDVESKELERESESSVAWRVPVFFVLFACFLFQGFLTYSDYPEVDPGLKVQLSGQALAGQAVWRANNCQSCHQLYGFGGFLGPDLTNVTARTGTERIHILLQYGGAKMPALKLPLEDRDKLIAFLSAMNETGQGTLRLENGRLPWFTFSNSDEINVSESVGKESSR